MSFIERNIAVTFTLGNNRTFGTTGQNTVTLENYRMQCDILNVLGPSACQANVKIHGLSLSLLNDLCSLLPVVGGVPLVSYNTISISAGDAQSGMTQVFQGNTTMASAINMQSNPDSMLEVQSAAGSFFAVQAIPPSSYPGTASVVQILSTLASQSPALGFENNGVSVVLATPYFPGSRRDQIQRCAEAAGIEWTIDNGTLSIWPRGSNRLTTNIPTVSPQTGMVGYPTNIGVGANVKTLFNPHVKVGGLVNVQSSLKFATGQFQMFQIGHELDSQTPGGRWFTTFQTFNTNGATQ